MCSWDLRLRNGDGLWAVEGLCKQERGSRVSHQDLFSQCPRNGSRE